MSLTALCLENRNVSASFSSFVFRAELAKGSGEQLVHQSYQAHLSPTSLAEATAAERVRLRDFVAAPMLALMSPPSLMAKELVRGQKPEHPAMRTLAGNEAADLAD